MIILGIDPGLANTGWGVVETRGNVCRARAYGCVSSKASEPLDQRLGRIFDEISEVIERYHPSQLAIEKIFFGENTRSAIATAHARGAAIVACSMAGLQMGEYTPMQIKQAVAGTGSAGPEHPRARSRAAPGSRGRRARRGRVPRKPGAHQRHRAPRRGRPDGRPGARAAHCRRR